MMHRALRENGSKKHEADAIESERTDPGKRSDKDDAERKKEWRTGEWDKKRGR